MNELPFVYAPAKLRLSPEQGIHSQCTNRFHANHQAHQQNKWNSPICLQPLSLISGKHKMVILYCLMEFETVRFNELKRYLKTISDKTLSTNLKELEADKLIVRTEYPQIPPKVEYALSERGKSLMTVLDQLCVWGEENRLKE